MVGWCANGFEYRYTFEDGRFHMLNIGGSRVNAARSQIFMIIRDDVDEINKVWNILGGQARGEEFMSACSLGQNDLPAMARSRMFTMDLNDGTISAQWRTALQIQPGQTTLHYVHFSARAMPDLLEQEQRYQSLACMGATYHVIRTVKGIAMAAAQAFHAKEMDMWFIARRWDMPHVSRMATEEEEDETIAAITARRIAAADA